MLMQFPNDRVVYGSDIGTATIEHVMSDDSTIPIGNIFSKRAELTLYTKVEIFKGDVFRLYLYGVNLFDGSGQAALSSMTHEELSAYTHEEISEMVDSIDGEMPVGGEYIPFGEFVTASAVRKGEAVTVTAYDKLKSADKPYVPGISFPAAADDVVDDILSQLGISGKSESKGGVLMTANLESVVDSAGKTVYCSSDYSFMIGRPRKKTCREVLGYIAAMYGRNGILDRNGIYRTFFMLPQQMDIFDSDKIDEPEISDTDISISGLRCAINEEITYEAGNPDGAYGIEIDCPYISAERLNEIWTLLRQYSWRPAEVHERIADPRRELGDMMCLDNYNIPITSLTYHFDGGLSADISSCGQLDENEKEV